MGRWDSREKDGEQIGHIPIKLIIILIGFVAIFWFVLVGLSSVQSPPDCQAINKVIHSNDFYKLTDEQQKLYLDLCKDTNNIIIK